MGFRSPYPDFLIRLVTKHGLQGPLSAWRFVATFMASRHGRLKFVEHKEPGHAPGFLFVRVCVTNTP